MVSAQSKNMDQVRIVVILFYPLLGQRLNLIFKPCWVLVGLRYYFSGLLNDLNAQH